MLTRIRIEAEGTTIGVVQEDIFATYDALRSLIWTHQVFPNVELVNEVITQTDAPAALRAHVGRWYKGRAVMTFPVGSGDEIDSHRIRGREEWLNATDDHAEKVGGVLPPRLPEDGQAER